MKKIQRVLFFEKLRKFENATRSAQIGPDRPRSAQIAVGNYAK